MDIPQVKCIPFTIFFLSQQLLFKNEQKMQFQASSNIHVAMETKRRLKTKLACVQLQICIDALYGVLTNVCTFVFVGHLIPQMKAFFHFCYCVATLVAMDTGYRNILTFFISFI